MTDWHAPPGGGSVRLNRTVQLKGVELTNFYRLPLYRRRLCLPTLSGKGACKMRKKAIGQRKIVCTKCPKDIMVSGHAFGCPNTRWVISDDELAEVIMKQLEAEETK